MESDRIKLNWIEIVLNVEHVIIQRNLETKAEDTHTAWGKCLWGCSHVQDMLTLKQIKL